MSTRWSVVLVQISIRYVNGLVLHKFGFSFAAAAFFAKKVEKLININHHVYSCAKRKSHLPTIDHELARNASVCQPSNAHVRVVRVIITRIGVHAFWLLLLLDFLF